MPFWQDCAPRDRSNLRSGRDRGGAGYDELIVHARSHLIAGITVRVAALSDIIVSKTEAARQKDLLALPELRTLAADADGRGESDAT
jgi:hypothetical protein